MYMYLLMCICFQTDQTGEDAQNPVPLSEQATADGGDKVKTCMHMYSVYVYEFTHQLLCCSSGGVSLCC